MVYVDTCQTSIFQYFFSSQFSLIKKSKFKYELILLRSSLGLQAGKQLGFTNVKIGSVKYKLMLNVIFEISIYTLESEKP